jgi:hypothetical protein
MLGSFGAALAALQNTLAAKAQASLAALQSIVGCY